MTQESARTPHGSDSTGQGQSGEAPGFTRAQVEALFMNAAREGEAELLARFLDAGMEADLRSDKGYTPLILATYNGHLEAARVLLAHGADVNAQDEKGATALAGVAFKGDLALARLLLEAGAGVDVANAVGRTPLMFAVMFGREDMVRLLLAAGADPYRRDGEGLNAIELAHRQGGAALAQVLAQEQGDP
ncbi:MAG: ankyrin repeat domain-containing protein [Acetobacter peroxydans]|nr:ankyrin repeat domain-containing protein [Acetobacter peroxydans]